jgi:hypothetical protein
MAIIKDIIITRIGFILLQSVRSSFTRGAFELIKLLSLTEFIILRNIFIKSR